MIPKKQAPALAAFTGACRRRGLSITHQRLAVYEAVTKSRTHPNAEEIFRTVRERYPTISRGTVYRTLDTLCTMGLVTDVNRTRDTGRFEAALEPHHHLVCLGCRRIIDVHDRRLDRLPAPAAEGFEVTGYQIQFTGYCAACRRRRQPNTRRP